MDKNREEAKSQWWFTAPSDFLSGDAARECSASAAVLGALPVSGHMALACVAACHHPAHHATAPACPHLWSAPAQPLSFDHSPRPSQTSPIERTDAYNGWLQYTLGHFEYEDTGEGTSVCAQVHVFVCRGSRATCASEHVHARAQAYMYVHMYMRVYVHAHVHVYVYVYVYIHVYIYLYARGY